MNEFIGELKDGSGKLYESEYKQKFVLSNDGSEVTLVLNDKSERVESIEEQRNILKNIKTSLQSVSEDIIQEI